MKKGFTLIETIIYIALISFLIGGGVVAAFSIIDASEKEKVAINSMAEAEFFLRKIDWALTGVASINLPASGTSGGMLSVNKNGFASNPLVFDAVSGRARLSRGAAPPVELTGDRVDIENLLFEHSPASLPQPAAIKISFTANGKHFQISTYLRK